MADPIGGPVDSPGKLPWGRFSGIPSPPRPIRFGCLSGLGFDGFFRGFSYRDKVINPHGCIYIYTSIKRIPY